MTLLVCLLVPYLVVVFTLLLDLLDCLTWICFVWFDGLLFIVCFECGGWYDDSDC